MTDLPNSTSTVAEAFALIDSVPLITGPRPHSAFEDENGVVHVYDANGHFRLMMSRADWEALMAYNAVPKG